MDTVLYTKELKELAKNFKCGNTTIDDFLNSENALDKNQGITYVWLSENRDFIIGYYNIETGRVDLVEEVKDKKYYRFMGGSVNINYLAIHSDFQGKNITGTEDKKIYLGDILLRDCEKRILDIRKQVGVMFVTLSSTQEGYHLYHERNSYFDFEEDMNIIVPDNDTSYYKLYKCVDDIL